MAEDNRSADLAGLPLEWAGLRVNDIFEIQQGKQVSKKNRIGDNQRPFLRTKNVMWGRLDLSELDQMHFTENDEQRLALNNGDLLLCEGGWVGRTAIWQGEVERCYYQNHLHRLRVLNGQADPMFALYWFWHAFELGNVYFGRKNVTTIPNMSKSRLGGLPMPLPSLPEQHRITAVLSLVQRAIEQQERLIALTTEMKKALMHELFTEGTRGEPQKQTEIGPIPESWEVVKIGHLAEKVSKGSSPKWQGFQYVEKGILFVRSQNVGNGRMDFSDRVCLSAEFNEKEKRSILKEGDILINLVGASIGRVALATHEVEGANCNQAVCFVRIDGSEAFKNLIVYFLLSPSGQEQMRRQKKDIARANLSLLDVKGFEIPLPKDENEAEETARVFLTLENKIITHEKRGETLTALFRTLLHQLMTAEIRVNELDLEELGLNCDN